MSGGSFNYLYRKEITEEDFLNSLVAMKESMMLHNYYEIALHLERIEQCFDKAEQLSGPLDKVFKAYEWYISNDFSQEEFELTMNEYLQQFSTQEVKEISSLTQDIRSLQDQLEQKRKELLDKLL